MPCRNSQARENLRHRRDPSHSNDNTKSLTPEPPGNSGSSLLTAQTGVHMSVRPCIGNEWAQLCIVPTVPKCPVAATASPGTPCPNSQIEKHTAGGQLRVLGYLWGGGLHQLRGHPASSLLQPQLQAQPALNKAVKEFPLWLIGLRT